MPSMPSENHRRTCTVTGVSLCQKEVLLQCSLCFMRCEGCVLILQTVWVCVSVLQADIVLLFALFLSDTKERIKTNANQRHYTTRANTSAVLIISLL